MSRATLLHRESSTKSLTTIVDNAHRHRLLFDEYEIDVRNNQLVLTCVKPAYVTETNNVPPPAADEGFESDVDSISIISTDESVISSKNQETDSANGSASSDSDDGEASKTTVVVAASKQALAKHLHEETFSLVNCVCYTDCKHPDVLVFVIHNETLVFKFERVAALQQFHANFSAIKAVSHQRTYATSSSINPAHQRFNLLQRTDSNGVTHIEIARQNDFRPRFDNESPEPSSIISINTPDDNTTNTKTLKKSLSSENLLDDDDTRVIRKVWNSAENLLDAATTTSAPQRPQRRKIKGPAPPPPSNVMKGQFVRCKVEPPAKPLPPPAVKESRFHFIRSTKVLPPLSFAQFKFSDPKHVAPCTLPRPLKKPQPPPPQPVKQQPMAYRYADAITAYQPSSGVVYTSRFKPASTISNRLFGMSAKLKEFGSVQASCNVNNKYQTKDPRYSSLGNLTDGTLKSVIKKNDSKRKNDKKVTFSAYNTVQVV